VTSLGILPCLLLARESVFAPTYVLYWQKTRGRHRIRNAQHVHIFTYSPWGA